MYKFDLTQSRQLYIVIRMALDYVIACGKLPHDNGIDSTDEASGILNALQTIGLIDTSAMSGKYFEPQPLAPSPDSAKEGE